MFLIVSLIMVLGYSAYFYNTTRRLNDKIASPLSKCVPMALGMTNSVIVGLVIAAWIPKMLALSTILSILLSAIIALLIGVAFGINGIIEAQASSMMGAMMGAMLGVMLTPEEMVIMIAAIDLLYLVSFYLLTWALMKSFIDKSETVFPRRPAIYYMAFVLSVSIICTIGFLQATSDGSPTAEEEIITHDANEHQH
ncbi:hypothetical protein ACEWK1_07010 [Metabacillus sp. YM-086]|uniref:hypothetical protein n=1 Tax=Metabacillus sp. YM-086 TaxID=3341729 RepID=UPI003A87EEB2